jgi:hypothetical protein
MGFWSSAPAEVATSISAMNLQTLAKTFSLGEDVGHNV